MKYYATLVAGAAFGAATIALLACTPAQQAQMQTTLAGATSNISAACAEALPLANLAVAIPTVGPFIAAGVQVGCATNTGFAKLAANPSSFAWLNQQIGLLRAALPGVKG